jgi:pimeloyl-ACP methyl ester carboxylesterase
MCLSWAAVTDGFVKVGTLRLHYQEWGPPSATGTVVLVHGVGSSCHIWDLTGPLLSERSLRVLALDQRGHGESDQPDSGYDFASVVADLAGFVEAVGVGEAPVMVGHSWGASVVLHFGVAHPERTAGLVLVDGGTASPGERWTWAETESRLTPPDIDGLLWSDLHQRILRNNGAYVDPRVEAVGRSLFHVDAHGRVSRLFRIPNHMQVVRALWEQRPVELMPQLKCPVLILPARQSSADAPDWLATKAANVQRALELQPAARVRWFEDTVHDVPLQRPEELADELDAFVQQILAARIRS